MIHVNGCKQCTKMNWFHFFVSHHNANYAKIQLLLYGRICQKKGGKTTLRNNS